MYVRVPPCATRAASALSLPSSMTTVVPSSHPLGIETWLRSVGIWWDESLIHIQAGCSGCSGPALGVFAQQDITENQLLCVIPRSAILSPRTTKLAAALEAEKLGGGLALTIAVMYEASLGAASKWAGYIESLPKREYLPMFWTDQELKLLEGTGLEGCAEEDRHDTEEDYHTHVLPLMTRHKELFPHPELCTLEHFRIAASWVASRSFHVDKWHGDAMVPLADIFNHKASLVLLDDAWKVAEEVDGIEPHHTDSHRTSRSLNKHSNTDPGVDEVDDGSNARPLDRDESDGDSDNDDNQGDSDDTESHDTERQTEGQVTDDEVHGDDDSEDPQHGFAVGGMPVMAGGIVHKGASSWVRDGVNLRLEIGICSLGPPDNADLAAAAAAGNDGDHEHDHKHSNHGDHDHQCTDECGHRGPKRQRTAQPEPQQQQQQQQPDAQQQQQQQQQWPEKRLEIIAASPIPAHAEVHNTYGEHSNAELVHKYGFCLPQNPFDEVQLGPSWSWLLLEVGQLDRNEAFNEHLQWLQQHSDVLPDPQQPGDPDDEAAAEESAAAPAIMPGGRLPLAAAAVIRVLGATASQLKKWESLEDVLHGVLKDRPEITTVAAAAEVAEGQPEAVGTAAAAAVLSEQFEDMLITTHDVTWWGRAGLEVLAAGLLERYWSSCGQPGLESHKQQDVTNDCSAGIQKGVIVLETSIRADQQALQECRQQHQQQQQQRLGDSIAGEHAAAVAAALQLRICEKQILRQGLEAVSLVLTGL